MYDCISYEICKLIVNFHYNYDDFNELTIINPDENKVSFNKITVDSQLCVSRVYYHFSMWIVYNPYHGSSNKWYIFSASCIG